MYCQISNYDLYHKMSSCFNKFFFETLNLRYETLPGFPRSVPWELYIPTTSSNFDFRVWYARKSSKLRARSRSASKTPRTGYWIPFLKTFVTRSSICGAQSALMSIRRFIKGSRINEQIAWKIYASGGCILYFRPLPRHGKNPPCVNEDFIYQISVWRNYIIFLARK